MQVNAEATEQSLCLKVKLVKCMQSVILAIQILNCITWMNDFNLSCVFGCRWRKA